MKHYNKKRLINKRTKKSSWEKDDIEVTPGILRWMLIVKDETDEHFQRVRERWKGVFYFI